MVYALLGVLTYWYEAGRDKNPEELISIVGELISNGISGLLKE